MVSKAIQTLESYENKEGVLVLQHDAAMKLRVVRNTLTITVTVPKTILEWFVDVVDGASGLRAEDWWDYAGYDKSFPEQLDREMAGDVARFMDDLLARQLRCVARERSGFRRFLDTLFGKRRADKGVLEWLIDGQWSQAVPFRSD